MPTLSEIYNPTKSSPNPLRLRILVYGKEKLKKTWWTGTAASAGYNVTYLSGDDQGWQILKQLPQDCWNRIHIIDAKDRENLSHYCFFITQLMNQQTVYWNNSEQKPSLYLKNQDHFYSKLLLSTLTPNDVLVIDYSALCHSVQMRIAQEQNIDFYAFDKKQMKWDFYRYEGAVLTKVIQQAWQLDCHVIFIAHETLREKRDKEGKEILWTQTQPISCSYPHGDSIGGRFTDILYFEKKGKNIYINTETEEGRTGGCRNIAPGIYRWEDLPFEKIAELSGIPKPQEEIEFAAIQELHPGEFEISKKLASPTLNAQNASSVVTIPKAKGHGLANLLGNKTAAEG